MLRFLKHISIPKSSFPLKHTQLSTVPLYFASKSKARRNTGELYHSREKARHSKVEANRRVIEELYFPDHSQMKAQEYIQEKQKLLLEENPDTQDKVELDEKDLKYIDDLSSQGTNVVGAEKSFRFPESREEMSKLIADTDVNDKLLKFYMKHHRQAGRDQIFQLLRKLEQNLIDEPTVREKEEKRYRRKVIALQKINKDIEVRFATIFLTKEEILQHSGFKFLVNNINFKAKQKIYQPYTVLELYHSLLKFDARAIELIDKEVLNQFELDMNEHSIYTLAKYLNLLQHFKKDKATHRLLESIYQALIIKDFSQINKQELLSILLPLNKIGLFANESLMFKLEPYVLKYIKEIETNKIADIFLTYLSFRRGSGQFMQIIMTTLLINIKRVDIGYLKTLTTLTNSNFGRRKDIQFEDLRRGAINQLMRNFKYWNYGLQELRQVLKAFVHDGLGNENYYDMISVEFMKRKDDLRVNTFMDIYYLLASADLNSQSLAYGCNRQILECIEELQASKDAVAGLLGKSESEKISEQNMDILPTDMKLNYYERKFADQFRLLMRTLWAYSYFIVRKEQWQTLSLDVWNQGIKQLNTMIKKLKQFTGLIPFTRRDLELAYQINLFSKSHAKNSFTIDLNELTDVNLLYKDSRRNYPMTFKTYLFWLERNYFVKKYKAFITKHKETQDYIFDLVLQNKSQSSFTNIFINGFPDFLGHYEGEVLRSKGYIRMREHYLQANNTPYVEIGYDQFSKDFANLKYMKEGYMENLLKKYIELPETSGSWSETDAAQLESIWRNIQEVREKIPETSMTFEEGLKEIFDKEVEKQATQDIVFDEQEEEDVYRDSDAEDQ